MEEFIDFIIAICGALFAVIVVGGVLYSIYCVLGGCEADRQREEALQYCFVQEPRTKDCEYMIWKYEIEHSKQKSHPVVVPAPIVIR